MRSGEQNKLESMVSKTKRWMETFLEKLKERPPDEAFM